MSLINEHYETIRKDIAIEFGLEAGGYAPAPKRMPIRIAQRIANKYGVTPQGIAIAKRYHSLFVR